MSRLKDLEEGTRSLFPPIPQFAGTFAAGSDAVVTDIGTMGGAAARCKQVAHHDAAGGAVNGCLQLLSARAGVAGEQCTAASSLPCLLASKISAHQLGCARRVRGSCGAWRLRSKEACERRRRLVGQRRLRVEDAG